VKLIKGNKVINATEKAYKVIYKNLGYKPYDKEFLNESVADEDKGTNIKPYDDITRAEIIEELDRKGIEYNPRDKKQVLYDLLIKGD